MKDKIRRVGWQVIREFWAPLVAAVIWTLFRVLHSEQDVASAIANFSASFFFASWVTGQIYRIIYRHDVEDSFQELGRELGAIRQTMEPMVRFAKMQLKKPGIEPEARAAADAILATAAQLTAANNAFLQASGYLDQSSLPTPLWTRANPRIYDQASAGPNWPPPDDEHKPTKTTSGS
jgi:hypothetical protein